MKKQTQKSFFLHILCLTLCITTASCGNSPDSPEESTMLPLSITPPASSQGAHENLTPSGGPDTTPIASATPIATPSATPAPSGTAELVPSNSPTPEPTPTPTEIPETPTSDMQVNYTAGFPIFQTNHSTLAFSYYNDEVVITDSEGTETIYHLSEQIQVENLDISDPELWYFIGAFTIDETVYAHYDYFNTQARIPSLLIAVDTVTNEFSCRIASKNPKKHFTDSFTCIGNTIYYTSASYSSYGTVTCTINYYDTENDSRGILFTGELGEQIPYLAALDTSLCYVLTDASQENSLYLFYPDTQTNERRISGLDTPEFLSTWRNYILLSTSGNQLTYYHLAENRLHHLTLPAESSCFAGQPMTDGLRLYIPLYRSGSSCTTILTIFPDSASVGSAVLLDTEYSHIIGMLGSNIYTETTDGYQCYAFDSHNQG